MSYGSKSITEWAEDVYKLAKSKGWHDDLKPNPGERIALIHSELSELLETFRDNPDAPCTKDILITAAEEEAADVLIRLLDFCQEFGLRIENAVNQKHAYNETRKHRHGGRKF